MRYYYTTTNNGDGSSGIEFFDDPSTIEMAEIFDPETYVDGEGGGYFDAPGGITKWNGFEIQPTTMADLEERYHGDA